MKIEKLTENKIRIILNIDELTEKNIDLLSLTKNTDLAQKLFKKMLKQAEKEVDFYADDSKLLIEAFISTDGFFIITFTKISPNQVPSTNKDLKLKAKRKTSNPFSKTAIYKFNSFDEFCGFCTYLNNTKLGNLKGLAKKIVFFEYFSKYFLVFSNINTDFENISLFYATISEFANLVSNSSCFYSKLIEYGKPIFKSNAIQNGIKYFSNSNI